MSTVITPVLWAALAYSAFSLEVFALALLGQASPPAVVCAGLATLGSSVWLWVHYGRRTANPVSRGDLAALMALAAVALPLLHVLLIPVYMRDDTIYHMVVPKLLAHTGALPVDPYNTNLNLPMLFEMPLVPSEQVRGAISPFLVNWGMLVALCIAFYAVAREHFGVQRPLALATAAVLMYTPALYDLTHSCYVETFFALLVVLASHNYLRFAGDRSNSSAWWLTMLLLGLACATKYLGALYVLFVAALEFFGTRDRRRFYAGLGLALLVCLPWYAKNWVLLGNPVYPMLSSLFPSPYLSPERAFQFSHLLANYHAGRGLVDYLLLPLRLLAGYDPAPELGQLGLDGKLSLLFAVSLLGLRFGAGKARTIALLFGAYFLFWAASSQQVRFLLPVAVLAAASGLQVVDRLWPKRRALVLAALALVMCQNLVNIGLAMHRDRIDGLVLGHISRGAFLTVHMPVSYGMAHEINGLLDPTRDRLLTVGNFGRNYYFVIPPVTNTYYDTEYLDRAFSRKGVDVAALEGFLRRAGVTHILFDRDYYRRLHAQDELVDTLALNAYMARACTLLLAQGDVHVLRWNQGRGGYGSLPGVATPQAQ